MRWDREINTNSSYSSIFLHKIVKNVLQTFPNDKLMLDTHSDIDTRADTHILFCIDPLNVDIKHTEVTENRYSSLTEHQLAKIDTGLYSVTSRPLKQTHIITY